MWNSDDFDWLRKNYPTLCHSNNTLEGRISFQGIYINEKLLLNPDTESIQVSVENTGIYICDSYRVRITFPNTKYYPETHEIGGRLDKVGERLDKGLLKMHKFDPQGSLCLASPMELERLQRQGLSLESYIQELLVPYLFAQSHHEKTGNWLWGELGHDFWSPIQWLGRQENFDEADIVATCHTLSKLSGRDKAFTLLSSRLLGHHKCVCGSEKKIRNCHPEVQRGVNIIRDYHAQQNINLDHWLNIPKDPIISSITYTNTKTK